MHYNVIGEEEEERKRQAVISRQIAWQLVTFFRGYVAIDDWEIYKKMAWTDPNKYFRDPPGQNNDMDNVS